MVTLFTDDVPVLTLPKESEPGETVMVGEPLPPPLTPVPLAVIVAGELEASLTIEAVAESEPVVCGVNVTVAVNLAPAAMVAELPTPLTEKLLEAPVTLTALMVAAPVPVFVMVTCCELLLPTATDPKVRLAGDTARVAEPPPEPDPDPDPEPDPLWPEEPVLPQPARSAQHARPAARTAADTRFDRPIDFPPSQTALD
ncbi:MAG TPA: hypothetical protein VE998_04610 [Terriglobales bacterium]|nr:hypothetical protein [Terriglobales bacterium]